jgi:hypothetical protein
MITVSILINGQPIFSRSATNITEEKGGMFGLGKQVYRVDTGELVAHRYEDGAVKLAIKLLKTIKEP